MPDPIRPRPTDEGVVGRPFTQPPERKNRIDFGRGRRPALTIALVVLVAIILLDAGVVGRRPLVVHGLADETAHALTALLWVTGAGSAGIALRTIAALLGGILLDLDHLPLIFDWANSPHGTSRPETHSLAPVALLLLLAVWDRSRRRWWGSAAFGVASHLWRDLGTGALVLWWPFSARAVGLPYGVYVVGMAVPVVGAVLWGTRSVVPEGGAGKTGASSSARRS